VQLAYFVKHAMPAGVTHGLYNVAAIYHVVGGQATHRVWENHDFRQAEGNVLNPPVQI